MVEHISCDDLQRQQNGQDNEDNAAKIGLSLQRNVLKVLVVLDFSPISILYLRLSVGPGTAGCRFQATAGSVRSPINLHSVEEPSSASPVRLIRLSHLSVPMTSSATGHAASLTGSLKEAISSSVGV